jgi:TPR repeat protein
VKQNDVIAASWSGAAYGDTSDMKLLADRYANGLGVPQDSVASANLLRLVRQRRR